MCPAAVNMVRKIRFPQNEGSFLNGLGTTSFASNSLLHGVSVCVRSVS